MGLSGNLYIADTGNSRIRKVDINGIITTVVGNGVVGYSGDGGAATNSSLRFISDITLDILGNQYIADSQNYRVREVSPNGIITTVAGKGLNTYSGDGGAAINAYVANPIGVTVDAAGNLLIASGNRVRKVTSVSDSRRWF